VCVCARARAREREREREKRETFRFKSLDIYYITGNGDIQWCFSQVKGTLEDDVTEGEFDLCLYSEGEREREKHLIFYLLSV